MKIIVLLIATMIVCGIAVAETAQSERGSYTTPNPALTTWLNSNNDFLHVHNYEVYEPEIELGVIADVTLYEMNLLSFPVALGVQSQYDFGNRNWGFYGKISINLSPKIKELLGQ